MTREIFQCGQCGKEEFDVDHPYVEKKCDNCGIPMKKIKGQVQTTLI